MKTVRWLGWLCVAWSLGLAGTAIGSDEAASLAAAERHARLRTEIARHDELYFRQAMPEISDAEYDALKRELRELEERFPILTDHRANQTVAPGDDRSGRFPTHTHRVPMRGLEKSFTEAELRKFLTRTGRVAERGREPLAFVIEPKFDGLAISLTYERGRLVRVVTRGNGTEGDVVTGNLLRCADVPRELRNEGGAMPPEFVEIRGEVYLSRAEFERINAERVAADEPLFAHPRNLAVGTLKSTDPTTLDARRLALVCFGWGAWEPAADAPATQRELLARLQAWGFDVPAAHVVFGPESVWQTVRALDVGRADFPGPLDGAVVKVDAVALRQKLGETREAPLWAIAYKFEPERAETRLQGITWQVGRTGVLTPVAELEPVQLGGTTVARASLHNRREIERRDYRVGDWVRVEKAGEIIPQLVGVNLAVRAPDAERYAIPTACPACATALSTQGGVELRCPNRSCPARVKRRVEHFVSESALNIRGFGPALVSAVVERGFVRDLDDVFALTQAEVPSKVCEQIEKAKRAELWRFVVGLGLPEVGRVNGRRLAEYFGSLDRLAKADATGLQAAGVSGALAEAILAELRGGELPALIGRLQSVGVEPQPPEARARGGLAGKNFVFTGSLSTLSREVAAGRVREAGGRVQSHVSRATSYVVAGEGGGRKLDDARRVGVPVLSEAEFLALLEESK